MDEKIETILDYVDGIAVPGERFREASNEYLAMRRLGQGLQFLYRQTVNLEETTKQTTNSDGYKTVIAIGRPLGVSEGHIALLSCAFQWYSVSACNYARMVGAIAYAQDSTRPKPPEYIATIMPEVLAYRDKVGAHVAWSTRNSKDTTAERFASVIPQISWSDVRYKAAALTLHMTRGGERSDSSGIQPWSLSEVHERLAKRFGPVFAGDTV